MRTAIVTGATGFIGRWLVRELLRSGIYVIAVILPESQNIQYLPSSHNLKIVKCPMEQYRRLEDKLPKQEDSVFYHLAWKGVSGPDRVSMDAQLANVVASATTVKVAKQLGCSAYVGLGSIMELEALAVTNTDGTKPGMEYLYGEAKHYAHLATKALASQLGIAHIWPILTNAYGEYEYSPRFINTTLRKILRHEPLEFTAGTQLYDFIHVQDAAKALVAVGKKGKSFCSYLIGSGHAAPLRTFIETIGRILVPDIQLHFGNIPFTGVQLPLEAYSIENLCADTGFVPEISFEVGIDRTMEWIRKESTCEQWQL